MTGGQEGPWGESLVYCEGCRESWAERAAKVLVKVWHLRGALTGGECKKSSEKSECLCKTLCGVVKRQHAVVKVPNLAG